MSRISSSMHACPLSRRDSGYLQVVLSEFELHRQEHGRHLRIILPDDPPTIVDRDGKLEIEGQARAAGFPGMEPLQKQLAKFEKDSRLLAYRFDCSDWPMRFANGGVLPVIHLDDRDYFLMFYRDIFPIGWNIANGASDNTDEWLDPTRIIQREFGEEVLICDPKAKRLFIHDPPGSVRPIGFHESAIQAWTKRMPELESFERVPMPLKWINGPDSVHVHFHERGQTSKGVFLSVTPPDHGIEVDRVAIVRLSGDIRFLSGEIARETLFNHVIGLFEVNKFRGQSGHAFHPDRIFFDGKEFDAHKLDEAIADYLKEAYANKLRSKLQKSDYEAATVRFDLCPISRAVTKRYFEWLDHDQQQSASHREVVPSPPDDARPPQIFISHRSTHVTHARALHDYLEKEGHSVFFSDESLAKLGESDYERSIGKALDQSQILILLALDAQDLESGWVDFEWKAFHCELLSKRKPQGQIFTLLHDVKIDQLPLPLRSRQSIRYSPSSPFDSFDNLYRYLKPALLPAGKFSVDSAE